MKQDKYTLRKVQNSIICPSPSSYYSTKRGGIRWPIRAILASRAAHGCRFVSRGPQLVLVGVTSLVGVADRIFLLPCPLMRLRPPKLAAGRARRNDIRALCADRVRLAWLVAGSGGRNLNSGRGCCYTYALFSRERHTCFPLQGAPYLSCI